MTTAELHALITERAEDIAEPEKLCHKCGEWWPATTEFFPLSHGRKLTSPCRACNAEQHQRSSAVKTCAVPGCPNPRHKTKRGIYDWRCTEHLYRRVNKSQSRRNLNMNTTYPHELSGTPTVEQVNDVAIWLYELILCRRNTYDATPTMSELAKLTGFNRSFLRGLLTVLEEWDWIAFDPKQAHCPLVITRVTDVTHHPYTVALVCNGARKAKPATLKPRQSNRTHIRERIRLPGSL